MQVFDYSRASIPALVALPTSSTKLPSRREHHQFCAHLSTPHPRHPHHYNTSHLHHIASRNYLHHIYPFYPGADCIFYNDIAFVCCSSIMIAHLSAIVVIYLFFVLASLHDTSYPYLALLLYSGANYHTVTLSSSFAAGGGW